LKAQLVPTQVNAGVFWKLKLAVKAPAAHAEVDTERPLDDSAVTQDMSDVSHHSTPLVGVPPDWLKMRQPFLMVHRINFMLFTYSSRILARFSVFRKPFALGTIAMPASVAQEYTATHNCLSGCRLFLCKCFAN
jgi:hypothetical protein